MNTENNSSAPSKTQSKARGGFIEFFKTIFYALLIAVAIRSFLFEPFSIPSGSMMPTLLIGDYLFVSKYSYGYSRYSFPFAAIPFSGRVLFQEPEQGDVVVFRSPSDDKVDFIKRIVGRPGDRVQLIDGVLHINGVCGHAETDRPFHRPIRKPFVRRYTEYQETLP
ncbi:MAG: signal peptidase I, partial [Rhodospirillales bacterium]|nr:signal peptidase I [Rhodospirillales bacterium]